jgi:hypothetical protein
MTPSLPRPWAAVEDDDSEDGWYAVAADKTVITFNVNRAEAHAIAAAPDLLAACKRLVELVTNYDPRAMLDGDEAMRDRYITAWRDMRAAIRKAEPSGPR